MSPARVIIDTDPGIDDALAVLLALASPELQVEALTTVHGNTDVVQATSNALSVLALGGHPGVPVAVGADRPLVKPLLTARDTHGDKGMGYATLPSPARSPGEPHAVDLLVERVLAHPGEITVVALGPLTNLALALRLHPDLAGAIPRLVVMGGAIRAGGNTTPLAEFNTYCDPHATHIVLHSGIPVTLVPLDATYQVVLTPRHLDTLLRVDSPVTRFVADSTRYYMDYHRRYQSIDGCALNDPLALALTFAPDLVGIESHPVDVDLSSGPSLGKTYADFYRIDRDQPTVDIAFQVDTAAFLDLFIERIQSLA